MYYTKLTEVFAKNIMLRAGRRQLSVRNKDDILHAVDGAYLSMQPRTYKKVKVQNTATKKLNRTGVLDNLAQRFEDYFNAPALKTQADFDDWHKKTCDDFLVDINNALDLAGYQNVCYGKAQKIVNVTFKNLYLFDDVGANLEYFKFCHFILDSANMHWYNSVSKKKVTTPWSKLSDKSYMDIQKDIRQYLPTQTKYPANPFEAEFYVWSDYRF
ncbi:MAG: hypothetical protein E7357_03890 [Clostridiales bacterium]|nr:hypothetical protein [Clostridiales bacterium]